MPAGTPGMASEPSTRPAPLSPQQAWASPCPQPSPAHVLHVQVLPTPFCRAICSPAWCRDVLAQLPLLSPWSITAVQQMCALGSQYSLKKINM